MFITKTPHIANLAAAQADLDFYLQNRPWPMWNQLGLTYRPGAEDQCLDAHGSLYDKDKQEFIAKESDFTEWGGLVGDYTKNRILELAETEGFKVGRVRYMRQMPKNGLSVHTDMEQRYHLVLSTNPHAFFGRTVADDDVKANCYHIPADGHFYKVDTTQEHFVYNGGWEPRIHLVICAV